LQSAIVMAMPASATKTVVVPVMCKEFMETIVMSE